jgi:hypothetical protein
MTNENAAADKEENGGGTKGRNKLEVCQESIHIKRIRCHTLL